MFAILAFVGCRSTEPTVSAEPWTRAQWLAAAEEVAADPLASRAKLDKLLSTDAWRKLDRSALATNGDVMRFYPAFKKLTMALASRGAVNDVIALGLYTLDVYPGIFVAGADFIAQKVRALTFSRRVPMRLSARSSPHGEDGAAPLAVQLAGREPRRDAVVAIGGGALSLRGLIERSIDVTCASTVRCS